MQSPMLAAIENQVVQLTREEQLALATWMNTLVSKLQPPAKGPKQRIQWELIDGIMPDGPDPLEFQHALRAEWDRELP